MDFKIKPYKHQLEMIEKSKTRDNLGFLWEMGTGKTGGVINCLRLQYAKRKRIMRTLVLTPPVTLYNWREEFSKHSKIPMSEILVLDCSGSKRLKKLTDFIMNYEKALVRNCVVLTNYEALQSKPFHKILMEWQPEVVIADESHYIKNHKAIRAKKTVELGDKATIRYIMTGTPILNTIQDIYMQFRFLDKGDSFGKNYFNFRSRYMQDENEAWSNRPQHFPKWGPKAEMFRELSVKMHSISSRILKKDCLKDLPPLIKTKRRISLSSEQLRMYKQMKNEFITWIKDKHDSGAPKAVVANIALTKALRLMQITTGFVKTEDEKIIEIEGKNPRIEATRELLEELTLNNKVILWCSFKHNYKQLSKLCDELNIQHTFLTGGMDTKQKHESMREFKENKDVKVIIANRRAGGIGVNLVEASYSIVFSRNFSLGEEKQSEARNHRGGSEIHDKIVKIDLCAKNTIDELVLIALQNKQALSDVIVDSAIKGEL